MPPFLVLFQTLLFTFLAWRGKGLRIPLNETEADLLMYTLQYLSNHPPSSPRSARLVFKQFFATSLGTVSRFSVPKQPVDV